MGVSRAVPGVASCVEFDLGAAVDRFFSRDYPQRDWLGNLRYVFTHAVIAGVFDNRNWLGLCRVCHHCGVGDRIASQLATTATPSGVARGDSYRCRGREY